ncbi:hypothetical protein V490_06153 [Pseudogymnoascus sp. VKM F-3557]|nr:hypothetical protein V490_06153 [Pseudogymnoascus sp. VKM F-3557]
MFNYKRYDDPRQTGDNYAKAGSKVPTQSPPLRTGKQERDSRQSRYLRPNQSDLDDHLSKNSRSHRGRFPISKSTAVNAGSMASTENELETSNTSVSEGQELPPENDGAFKQNKLLLPERIQPQYQVGDSPTGPALPAQLTTSRQISNEDYGAATPKPIHPGALADRDGPSPGAFHLPQPTADPLVPRPIIEHSIISMEPLHSALRLEQISETSGVVEGVIDEARQTISGIPVTELSSIENFDIISIEDEDPSDGDGNKSLDLDWLCTQDREERGYMTVIPLIPYSLSSVEPPKVFPKPSKAEVQKVAQQRLNVRRRRFEIQKLKSLLRAKEKQIFDENEETFKRLREFVTEHHRRPKIRDSSLELASRLFFASRTSRDECGPLNDEISSLEERLAFEEIKLTQAEDSLYESFGMPPMQSENSRGNSAAMPGLPILHPPRTSGSDHTSAGHINEAEGDDDYSDDDLYSNGSSENYGKNYHPLYIEYQEHLGAQDNLYERRAYIMEDQDRLEDQQQNRQRVGLTLLRSDQDFLNSLPEALRVLDVKIDEYRVDIENLRARCLEQGIIDENDNYIDDNDSENSDDSTPLPQSIPLAPQVPSAPPAAIPPPATIRTPIPPISPPATASLPSAHSFITSNLGARLDEQSYQNRINPWLLGKLAASRAELALLATVLTAMGAEPDVASLLDVFRMWEHDGAGMEPPRRPERLDEATLNKLRRVTRKVVGDGFDRALLSSLFGLSLWSGETYGGGDETAYLGDDS